MDWFSAVGQEELKSKEFAMNEKLSVTGFSEVGQEELERVNGGIGGMEPIVDVGGGGGSGGRGGGGGGGPGKEQTAHTL